MVTRRSHTDKTFERELATLRDRLLAMGARAEAMIAESVLAVADRDSELADHVITSDAELNRLEVAVDELCAKILALRQPAASDLRLITTALKIVTDLERIGDLSVNIAERAVDLNRSEAMPIYGDLPHLAELAQQQLKAALDAFVRADADAALKILANDELLDSLFVKLFNELIGLMMEDSRNIRRATNLLFVAKHLERIGDHAMNIAEMTVYMVKGTDIRHPRSRELNRHNA
ncbi:MAG: phosphate signaling complex protein PhoU [Myxococcota bacterium]|jgi:phosphate transport system protein